MSFNKRIDKVKQKIAQDKKRKESVDARNQADSLLYTTEKSVKEYGNKLEKADKDKIDSALKELKEVLDNKDAKAEDIKAKVDALNAVAMKLGEIMYKESQQKNEKKDPASKSNGKGKKEEDVVDADFEEVKPESEEDKKSAKK